MRRLSHYDETGKARMVDVSSKPDTVRTASASAFVKLKPSVLKALPRNPKGNPLEIARVAGVMAAKKTSDLIPMCHPLLLKHVDVDTKVVRGGIRITSSVTTTGATGVEMEALTAVTVAALTVYDMTKALDKGIEIESIHLLEKTGGNSGDWRRK
jgi:cyclic pyranopterin monophosphate synthase